mmetsp:Transcript_27901/g.53097  ORF Transcript_27901/g.53097 Transcript_27901/m.53097 type:complete len:349 (+) Transcript_27901:97-1143(+)|eukprot:CAMPEP_0114254704 /NCGR_PEP_ID=MMETSP0058-20121206/17147_1 /TAXON_ID=36894 /ORGANISM="Pyramimonas parkeae, CCMP726" /LENGTH=348 /DNA_ID=CAMNT_0001368993 /DNA_START=60 /DNA_END=1106 /DNA_ORIENTATION=-
MSRFEFLFAAALGALAMVYAEDYESLRSGELQRVIDAAVTRVEKVDWVTLVKENSFDTAVEVATCTPDDEKWTWPSGDVDTATGLWKRVLQSNELKVGAVRWQTVAANYFAEPPTGFWPAYLDKVMDQINAYYKTNIKVKRTYYENSVLNLAAVAAGAVDVSEPYYYISGFLDNNPRIEAMHHSCVTAGTQGHFFTKVTSSIGTMDELINEIDTTENKSVGFIGQGNYDSNKALLPESVQQTFVTNSTYMENQVEDGKLLAGYVSEGFPSDPDRFNVFPNGIVAPRVFLFRMDEGAKMESSNDDTEPAVLAVLVVLAVLGLVLALLLGFLVYKEKQGTPIFTQLKDVI